jgi:hypothetical protein
LKHPRLDTLALGKQEETMTAETLNASDALSLRLRWRYNGAVNGRLC